MKKLLILSALLIFSCSKDNDKSNDLNSIEGRWNLVSMTDEGESQELSSCNLASYMTLANGLGDYYVYSADGSNAPCTAGEMIAFSYSADGILSNTYYLTVANETNDGEIVMKVNGNSLVITEKFDYYEYDNISTYIRD